MQSAFDLVGISPRWSRYQIQAGRIAPNRKSEFQALFDPWVEFRENAEVYRTVARPYVPMLALERCWANYTGRVFRRLARSQTRESQLRKRMRPFLRAGTLLGFWEFYPV